MKEFTRDGVAVGIYPNRRVMGEDAAELVAGAINELLAGKGTINIIFAAAPSQNEFLAALVRRRDVDFSHINAFHMDEYIGLAPSAPQSFANFLRRHLFDKVRFRSVNLIDGQAENPQAECARYAELLAENPADIVCMGLGENAHIAFNDPGIADFSDPRAVKVVHLAEASRIQQVNDGCFAELDEVPEQAITLTVPSITRGARHFCMVPAATKARAVYDMLTLPVNAACPGTVLRTLSHVHLLLDTESAALLPEANG